ncbi:helix-turn-helix domain-containing protein [soil metagenome]
MRTHPAESDGASWRRDSERLTRVRADFPYSGTLTPDRPIADAIQASWQRSKMLRIDVEKVHPAFISHFNTETQLSRSAAPVLLQLADELANEPVSIILTDASGLVLQRLSPSIALTQALDAAGLAPGFNYSEQNVGTNGIGTALERRAPTVVDGREHYTEFLGGFSCAGAPIMHPITGALIGIIDLTSLATDSNRLLLAVAKSTATRIQQHLLSQANARELALFADYLTATKHGESCVLAVGEDLTILSAHTDRHFDADDRAALLARSADAEGATEPSVLLADLPSGHTARMEYHPVFVGKAVAGGVFRIQRNPAQPGVVTHSTPAIALPGVVGSSAIWQQTCRAIELSNRRGENVVLEGEEGVGKLALLRGVHQLRNPTGSFRVIDAADCADPEAWLDGVSDEMHVEGGTLVLRHVHLLSPEVTTELSALLLEFSHSAVPSGPWVTMTVGLEPRNAAVEAQLLPHFPRTIEVPPLRRHMEDLRALVPQLLGRVQRESAVTMSLSAMDQLMRLPWHGNVQALARVIAKITRVRRTGEITVDDLPASCRATSRRQFTRLEEMERDAIVQALGNNNGGKDAAAVDLGMSRSTIYRKVREYGIVWFPA